MSLSSERIERGANMKNNFFEEFTKDPGNSKEPARNQKAKIAFITRLNNNSSIPILSLF
jgi:hypothetical protein